jgi:LysR family glycine cleavage system transcriptional activator
MSKTFRHYSLRELRAFCTVVELGSFRAAAERLFLTASAISHQIKNLEAGLGVRLFERGTRSLKPTNAGQELYNDIQPLIEDFDVVIAEHARTVDQQRLRISVQPFFASELFVPRLKDFRNAHPDLDITVDSSDESVEKHRATADVSIRIFRSPPADLVSHRLLPLRLIPAGSPRFYDQVEVRAGKIVSEFPLIVHESRPRAWRQWERSSGISLPNASSITRLDSMIAVVRAVERSIGAALVPAGVSDALFHSDTIVAAGRCFYRLGVTGIWQCAVKFFQAYVGNFFVCPLPRGAPIVCADGN